MSFIDRLFSQTITYWGSPSTSGWGGKTFDTPITLSGRWEDKQELFIDPMGNEVRSLAVVYVDQDVDLGGYLYLGTSTESDPETVSEAREIRSFAKVPSIDGETYLRKVWL